MASMQEICYAESFQLRESRDMLQCMLNILLLNCTINFCYRCHRSSSL